MIHSSPDNASVSRAPSDTCRAVLASEFRRPLKSAIILAMHDSPPRRRHDTLLYCFTDIASGIMISFWRHRFAAGDG
jgi:hypothetical protein